ncbi:MAG: hypothetical protein ACKVQS_08685 [Fimbriimonadaceae bacterium]
MFTRPDVIKRLKTEFIPFAGNTNELQVSKFDSPEKKWFLEMASQLSPGIANGGTAQGFYVVGADGQEYVYSIGGRQHDAFMNLLDEGLAKFKSSPPKAIKLDILPIKTWTRIAPKGGLVVRSITRVSPLPSGADVRNTSIGRDHYWIFPEDIGEINNSKGNHFAMPTKMARRMARFHLVDNVRGEPNRWRYDNIRVLDIEMTRVSPMEYNFEGLYKLTNLEGHGGTEKGIAGRIRGFLTLNKARSQATQFEAYAEGYAWGDHENTSGAPPGKFPLKIAFRSVDDEIARSVPPQQSYFWDEYLNPLSSKRTPWP